MGLVRLYITDCSKAILMWWFLLFYVLVLNFWAVCTLCAFLYIKLSLGNYVAAHWKIAAHSAYDVFSLYKYLNCKFRFSHLCFWSGDFFLVAPFPDQCLFLLLTLPIFCRAS